MSSTARPETGAIQHRDGLCGGAACLRESRITVWSLAAYRRLGLTDSQIQARVHGVTSADLAAAWAYCAAHPEEIEHATLENESE